MVNSSCEEGIESSENSEIKSKLGESIRQISNSLLSQPASATSYADHRYDSNQISAFEDELNKMKSEYQNLNFQEKDLLEYKKHLDENLNNIEYINLNCQPRRE